MENEGTLKREGDEPVILIVDDEPSVLSSLRRLFRGKQYEIITESSPAQALKRLDNEHIDLIISDMRMPEINGTEVLRHAADRQPDSVRILLTGYADLEDAIEAVNEGGIFRYLTKPWDNKAIVEAVESGLYVKELETSNQKLAEELSRQNAALKDLTATLAGRVRNRNRDFESNLNSLKAVSEGLDSDLGTITRILTGLIESLAGDSAGSTGRIAHYASALAQAAECTPELIQQIHQAAQLHELGKVVLDRELILKPESQLNHQEQKLLNMHAVLAACMLGQTNRFREAAQIIRHVTEHFDGCGEPDQLSRIGIPMGSRILAVAIAYERLRGGQILGEAQSPEETLDWIRKRAGRNFDPQIVEQLVSLAAEFEEHRDGSNGMVTRTISVQELGAGMVLAKDLLSEKGLPLALAGYTFDAEGVAHLKEYEALTGAEIDATILTG